jgi:hypothetical protein
MLVELNIGAHVIGNTRHLFGQINYSDEAISFFSNAYFKPSVAKAGRISAGVMNHPCSFLRLWKGVSSTGLLNMVACDSASAGSSLD